MSTIKYYDTGSSTWKYLPQGPVGPQGPTGPTGPSGSGSGDMLKVAYDPANISQQVVGTTATQTLTNKTLTSPKADFITDTSGGKEIELVVTASSANWVKLTNTTTGNGVIIGANGTGANEDLVLAPLGTGQVKVGTSQVTTAANTQTLTGKSMSGASNTFSSIPETSVTNLTSDLALKAPLASPTFTGAVTVPSPVNSTDAVTKAYSDLKAPLASPAFTGLVGFGTAAPTHTASFASTGTGIALYATSDQTTNYERLRMDYSGTTYRLIHEAGGTGTVRDIVFGNTKTYRIINGQSASGSHQFGAAGIGVANAAVVGISTIFNPTSGTSTGLIISSTYNQTSTAGSADIVVNRIDTTLGSGSHSFLDLRVAGTSKVSIRNDGVIKPVQATTAAAPAYVLGGIYFDTTLNKLRIGGATAWETVTSS